MTDQHIRAAWYRFAAGATGFLGAALRTHRTKAFLSQEQQRARMGIGDHHSDALWRRLQAMLLPRSDHVAADLAHIAAKIQKDLGIVVEIDLEHWEDMLRNG